MNQVGIKAVKRSDIPCLTLTLDYLKSKSTRKSRKRLFYFTFYLDLIMMSVVLSLYLICVRWRPHWQTLVYTGGPTANFSIYQAHAKRVGPKGLRAQSARAFTGRRCPYSGKGEDFLSRQPNFFTETAVTPERKVEKSFPRWEINRHAEG